MIANGYATLDAVPIMRLFQPTFILYLTLIIEPIQFELFFFSFLILVFSYFNLFWGKGIMSAFLANKNTAIIILRM